MLYAQFKSRSNNHVYQIHLHLLQLHHICTLLEWIYLLHCSFTMSPLLHLSWMKWDCFHHHLDRVVLPLSSDCHPARLKKNDLRFRQKSDSQLTVAVYRNGLWHSVSPSRRTQRRCSRLSSLRCRFLSTQRTCTHSSGLGQWSHVSSSRSSVTRSWEPLSWAFSSRCRR